MKKLLLLLALALASNGASAKALETKKICVNVKANGKDVTDPKTRKPKQSCKEVKVHKKLNGTKVPSK